MLLVVTNLRRINVLLEIFIFGYWRKYFVHFVAEFFSEKQVDMLPPQPTQNPCKRFLYFI